MGISTHTMNHTMTVLSKASSFHSRNLGFCILSFLQPPVIKLKLCSSLVRIPPLEIDIWHLLVQTNWLAISTRSCVEARSLTQVADSYSYATKTGIDCTFPIIGFLRKYFLILIQWWSQNLWLVVGQRSWGCWKKSVPLQEIIGELTLCRLGRIVRKFKRKSNIFFFQFSVNLNIFVALKCKISEFILLPDYNAHYNMIHAHEPHT
jgi:hypothetical protein